MNLYVSNLSFRTTDDELRNMFSRFGEVSSAKIITDRETGRSRGFGFVEMHSDSDAHQAINQLNQTEVDGRAMGVSVAREKPGREDNKRRW